MFNIIFIIVGIFFMVKGADILVSGSSAMARRLNIPSIVIGLTIVAFGTSAPELAINVLANLGGKTEIALSNIFGSNIANILLVLGVAGAFYPFKILKETIWRELPFSLFASLFVALLANIALISGSGFWGLSLVDGLILLAFLSVFLYYLAYTTRKHRRINQAPVDFLSEKNMWVLALTIILGLAGLAIGGKITVDSAVALASSWGLSQSLVGLTIIAIGTSLPELFASVVAAHKGEPDIAIGNIIGSNIFNIFWVLGISAVIRPLPFTTANNQDIIVLVAATILIFLFMFIGRKYFLKRWQGILLLAVYFAYLYAIVTRG